MKKIGLLFCLSILLFANIGKVTALIGKTDIQRDNKLFLAKIGLNIENKDIFLTHKNSKIQLMFKDDTVVTIGPNSKFSIENYLFNNKKSKANFSFTEGVIKVLDGTIGKLVPKNFTVKTPNAIIGIRGTMFVIEITNTITKVGMLQGQLYFKPFHSNKMYFLKNGQFLIFNHKTMNIKIKTGFIEPKILSTNTHTSTNTHINKNQNTMNLINNIDSIFTSTSNQEKFKTNTIYTNDKVQVNTLSNSDNIINLTYDIIDPSELLTNSNDINYLANENALINYRIALFSNLNNQIYYGASNLWLNFSNQEFDGIFTLNPQNSPNWIFNVHGIINNNGFQATSITTLEESQVKNIDGTLLGNIFKYKYSSEDQYYDIGNFVGGNFDFKGTYNNENLNINGVFISIDHDKIKSSDTVSSLKYNVLKFNDYTMLGYWEKDGTPFDVEAIPVDSKIVYELLYDTVNIQNLIDNNAEYKFEGDLAVIVDRSHLSQGTFNIDINFGNQEINGIFNFTDYNNNVWEYTMSGNINNNGKFYTENISETENSDIKNINGRINGGVYKNANVIYGHMDISGDDSSNNEHYVDGDFVGLKQ